MAIATEHARPLRNGAARAALKARATDVIDDFGVLRKDVKKLARAANKAARAEATNARRRVGALGVDLRDRASERVDMLGEQVRERPGAAIGISLGVGLLLGMLLSPRH